MVTRVAQTSSQEGIELQEGFLLPKGGAMVDVKVEQPTGSTIEAKAVNQFKILLDAYNWKDNLQWPRVSNIRRRYLLQDSCFFHLSVLKPRFLVVSKAPRGPYD